MIKVYFDVTRPQGCNVHRVFDTSRHLIGRFTTLAAVHDALIQLGHTKYRGYDGHGRVFDTEILPFDPD